jgi:cytochrome P450
MATSVSTSTKTSAYYNYPYGPPPKPFIGSTLDFDRDPLGFVTSLHQTYGKAATAHFMGGFSIVAFFTPTAARYILTENPRNFTSREFNSTLTHLLGDGLLTIDGDFHRQQRRLVQPAFHRKRIDSYATIMTQHTEEMLETWRKGEVRDLNAEMQRLTLRIVAKTLFDVDLKGESAYLGQVFSNIIRFPSDRRLSWKNLVRIDAPFTPWGQFQRNIAILDKAIYQIIEERRASRHDKGDVISMLLAAQDEDGTVMTNKQVHDETMTFFAAGHETTSNALMWTWYLLSQNPHIAERLHAELRDVLGGRAPVVEDLPRLPYTDMVIKESMRLYPPAWAIGRRAIDDFEVNGYHLPAGQIVMMSQWVMHRAPEIWGADALEFKPERFDPAHPQDVPQFAYFPFGGGPRMCIGMPFAQMEARLILATVAQHYSPRLVPGHRVVPTPMVTLRSKYGMRMILE